MNKIIVLKAAQGAGKSSWAMNYQKENPNTMVVSRDSIRESLVPNHRETWYKRRDRKQLELIVTNLEWASIVRSLTSGYDVIMDSTNTGVTRKSIQDNIETYTIVWLPLMEQDKYEVEFISLDTPLEVCIERDSKRKYPVGEKIIRRTYKRLNNQVSNTQ